MERLSKDVFVFEERSCKNALVRINGCLLIWVCFVFLMIVVAPFITCQ